MKQSKIKEIIKNDYYSNPSKSKLNEVAKVASKFINKYQSKFHINTGLLIDVCLGSYNSLKSGLEKEIEHRKNMFFVMDL